MKINFQCIELSIQDQEMGCTVTFSDSKSADDQYKTEHEIMNSVTKYLLIQKTYAEDEYDMDYCYMESSELSSGFDPNEKMIINLNQERLETNWHGEQMVIGLSLKKLELENLLRILKSKFNEQITICRK